MDKNTFNKVCWSALERIVSKACNFAANHNTTGPFTNAYSLGGAGLFDGESEDIKDAVIHSNAILVLDNGAGKGSVLSKENAEVASFAYDDIERLELKNVGDALFINIRLGGNAWRRILLSVI